MMAMDDGWAMDGVDGVDGYFDTRGDDRKQKAKGLEKLRRFELTKLRRRSGREFSPAMILSGILLAVSFSGQASSFSAPPNSAVKTVQRLRNASRLGGHRRRRPVALVQLSADVGDTPTPDLADQATTTITVASVRTIVAFAIPAIGIWLCSPLLSMIDTSTVGLLAGVAQQAALNPATAITDYSARTLSFLYTATTNMVAQDHNDKAVVANQVFGALQVSFLVGVGLGSFLFAFARPLLRLLIGNDVLDPDIFSAALKYVRIRSLGMPAAALIGTSQAVCLGMQDVKNPLNLILVASVVNLLMDLLLVGSPSAWLGGAAGAAWATIASQYFAISLFFLYLGKKAGDAESATRGFLAGRLSLRNFLCRPNKETTCAFAPYVIPVTTTQIGRCSTYIAMGHVVSSSLGTVSMAANQIITSIFYALIPIADSLSLTAQTFLPGIVARAPSDEKAKAIQTTTMNLFQVAGMLGLFLAGVVACIPTGCHLFTTDLAVMALVRKIVPVLFIVFSLHGVFCGSEGIMLAQRDLGFLGRMYAVFFAVVPYLMLRIKRAAKTGASVDLSSVWLMFLRYQLFRVTVWVGRVAWLQQRTNREARDGSSAQ